METTEEYKICDICGLAPACSADFDYYDLCAKHMKITTTVLTATEIKICIDALIAADIGPDEDWLDYLRNKPWTQ